MSDASPPTPPSGGSPHGPGSSSGSSPGAGRSPLSVFWRPDAQRWRLGFVLMISLFVGYLDRVNISLALPLMGEEYGWDDAQLTSYGELLFSVFYVGYGLANIFLSPLAARIGPRVSMIVIVVLWSVFTGLGAVASQVLLALAATRILLGVSEGVHFPMMNMLTRAWFPPEERGRANSIWISGLFLAVLLSPVLLVPAMHAFGWRIGFWGLAAVGLFVTLPLVLRSVHNTPRAAPGLSTAELDHIEAGIAAEDQPDNDPAHAKGRGRVRRLFGSPSFLLLLTAGILNNIVALGLTSWLPSFFVRTKGLPFEQLTWAVSLPFAGSIFGVMLWSNLGDRTNARALIAAGGYIVAGVLVFFSLSAGPIWMVMAFFAAAVFMTSAYTASEFALLQRALPAGSLGGDVGLYNGLTTMIGGGLGPVIVSAIVGDPQSAGALYRLLVVPSACALLAIVLIFAYRRLRY